MSLRGGPRGAYAQQKLLSPDGHEADQFGFAVGLEGDRLVVSANLDDDRGMNTGTLFAFARHGSAWEAEGKLPPTTTVFSFERLGTSLDVSGAFVVAGAPEGDKRGTDSGSLLVFKREETGWQREAELFASDSGDQHQLGLSCAIDGDYIIGGTFVNAAYIYKREVEGWVETDKLTHPDGNTLDRFGWSVDISGDYAAVASLRTDHVFVYKREGEQWVEQVRLSPPDGAGGIFFGRSLSLDGDFLMVGAHLDRTLGESAGAVYIYRREGDEWLLDAKLTASDGAAFDRFGTSIAISGDFAIVGAVGSEGAVENTGGAYVYRREDGHWVERAKLIPADGERGEAFGTSVAISDGGYAVVGVPYDDELGFNSGSVYVYDLTGLGSTGLTSTPRPGPGILTLSPVYPNPAQAFTTLPFYLYEPAFVQLQVWDGQGRVVRTPVRRFLAPGQHEARVGTSGLAGGIYHYRITAGKERAYHGNFVVL